jgi:putative transposase
MEYRTGSHTKYRIQYHFVWVTKYRYHMLVGELAHRLRELVRRICEGLEVEIVRGVVSKDHVHLLVSAPPDISPAEIMRQVKGKTSLKIFEEFPHVKKRYWGRHFWARGYFCVTAGELTKEMIQDYLEHHFERKPEDGFDIEPAL